LTIIPHSRGAEAHHLHVVVSLPLAEHMEVRWIDLQQMQWQERSAERAGPPLHSGSGHGGGDIILQVGCSSWQVTYHAIVCDAAELDARDKAHLRRLRTQMCTVSRSVDSMLTINRQAPDLYLSTPRDATRQKKGAQRLRGLPYLDTGHRSTSSAYISGHRAPSVCGRRFSMTCC
jgi:hypothetical protein